MFPSGGHWEHVDDGYHWWYKVWDVEGTLVEEKSGYHHISGGSGFQLARGTVTDGQDETAPLGGLQGGRADHAVEPTGDMDGDGVPDHLDRDMDGDGIPNHRDSDKNGNGIRDWEEEQQARRQARAARKLFNEFWTGLSDIGRQQWRKDYAQGKLDMLQEFLHNKLLEAIENSQALFSVSDPDATTGGEEGEEDTQRVARPASAGSRSDRMTRTQPAKAEASWKAE